MGSACEHLCQRPSSRRRGGLARLASELRHLGVKGGQTKCLALPRSSSLLFAPSFVALGPPLGPPSSLGPNVGGFFRLGPCALLGLAGPHVKNKRLHCGGFTHPLTHSREQASSSSSPSYPRKISRTLSMSSETMIAIVFPED